MGPRTQKDAAELFVCANVVALCFRRGPARGGGWWMLFFVTLRWYTSRSVPHV